MKVTLSINNNKTVKVLPVIPEGSVSIDYGQSTNQNKDSVKYGQIKVLGAEPLATVQIDAFFPSDMKADYVTAGASGTALGYIKWLRDLRKNRKTVRVVITDNNSKPIFNRLMAIETFNIQPIDRAGDYPYSITFEQYRAVK